MHVKQHFNNNIPLPRPLCLADSLCDGLSGSPRNVSFVVSMHSESRDKTYTTVSYFVVNQEENPLSCLLHIHTTKPDHDPVYYTGYGVNFEWKDNKSFRLRWQPFYTVHLNARYKELVPYSRQVPSSVPTFLVFILTQADKRQTTHLAKSVYRKQRIIKKSDHCCVLKAKNKKFRSLLCTENKE